MIAPVNKEFRITNFREFWQYYLQEHSKRGTRLVHFIFTNVAFCFLATFFVTLDFKFILIGLLSVYGPAFLSHFLIEKNRPATFKYPIFSVGGDLKMWFYMLTGRIKI